MAERRRIRKFTRELERPPRVAYITRIRGVLTDTLTEAWAAKLTQTTIETDPRGKGSPLFWFSVTKKIPLDYAAKVFDRIWVGADKAMHGLLDL